MHKKRTITEVPTFDQLIIPTINALVELGGSGSNEEINQKVYSIAEISEDILQIPQKEGGVVSKIDYRLAWARTYLKKFGLLNNSSRGIWALSKSNIDVNNIDTNKLIQKVRKKDREQKQVFNEVEEEVKNIEGWKEILLDKLYSISPDAFERLSQRLLRESGFFHVEVTGKTNDGGIDGKGIVRINGVLSFHVIFQCKRYRGSVSSSQIRDFRGAMQGRTDKGIFITTGSFTRDAVREATREGAPPIDLIDGDMLCDLLRGLRLGISTKLIEVVELNENWFDTL